MNLTVFAATAYGAIVLCGGIIGYVRAKSKASLVSGCLSGILLIIAAWLQLQNLAVGLILARIITLLLMVVFVIRLVKTKKFMPAGIMLITGAITLALLFS
ncbi:TMEM14 family protein [Myxosarcina sp. GI1(2024)]